MIMTYHRDEAAHHHFMIPQAFARIHFVSHDIYKAIAKPLSQFAAKKTFQLVDTNLLKYT